MTVRYPIVRRATFSFAGLLLLAGALTASAAYRQTNLVSDLPDMALHQDPLLVNPWGIAYPPEGPFWISDNHSGVSTLYDAQGNSFPLGNPLIVTIPPPPGGTGPSAPTGVVFNNSGMFGLPDGTPARFLFATEDGTVAGWNAGLGTSAALLIDNSSADAIYKSIALLGMGAGARMYLTNFHEGTVEVYDGSLNRILQGSFQDPNIPAGFAPFGIRNIEGRILVTYALQDSAREDDVAGPGNGFVDAFNPEGHLMQRFITRGDLNSPWGLAVAPQDFGEFGGDLLIGNFGDGKINAYRLSDGELQGELRDSTGAPLVNRGLWDLTFGNGNVAGPRNVLFFTAGIPGDGHVEDHGLFGSIRNIEAPTPVLLTSFEAAVSEGEVVLRWSTPVDVTSLGFHVYRSEDGVDWTRLTEQPVLPSDGRYEYRDGGGLPAGDYWYAVAPLTGSGEGERSAPVEVPVRGRGRLALSVGPVPAAGSITAVFSLPEASPVRVAVVDVQGRERAVLADGSRAAGTHRLGWNGKDRSGRSLPAGTYFLRVNTAREERTASFLLVR